jgi:hypothetical protein
MRPYLKELHQWRVTRHAIGKKRDVITARINHIKQQSLLKQQYKAAVKAATEGHADDVKQWTAEVKAIREGAYAAHAAAEAAVEAANAAAGAGAAAEYEAAVADAKEHNSTWGKTVERERRARAELERWGGAS